MKKLILMMLCTFIWNCAIQETYASGNGKKDTVEVVFGNNSKITIYVDNEEDLNKLRSYDLNKMLKDLNIEVEESDKGKEVLVIKDETGKRYLKDTSIVLDEDPDFRELQKEFMDRDWETSPDNKDHSKQNDNSDNYGHSSKLKKKEHKEHSYKRTDFSTLIDIGMNNYISEGKSVGGNELYNVRPWGSWYFAIRPNMTSHIKGKLAAEWGADISWYNFKYQNNNTLMEQGDMVGFTELPDKNGYKSKLTVSYLDFNFVPVLDFGYKKHTDELTSKKYYSHDKDKFRIGLGGYAGYRLNSYSKNVTKVDGDKNKDHSKNNFNLNDFRYGVRFFVGIEDVDIFFNYDLNELYANGKGPNGKALNAFSFGVSF